MRNLRRALCWTGVLTLGFGAQAALAQTDQQMHEQQMEEQQQQQETQQQTEQQRQQRQQTQEQQPGAQGQQQQAEQQRRQQQVSAPNIEELRGVDVAIPFAVLDTASKRDVQQRLQQQGHYRGPIDAIAGEQTRQALLQFQRSQGLEPTGQLDLATARALDLGLLEQVQPVRGIEEGAPQTEQQVTQPTQQRTQYSEQQIRDVQSALQERGHYDAQVDGIMGTQTQSAIRDFQRENDLEVTGKLDSETLDALGVEAQMEQPTGTQPERQPGVEQQQGVEQQPGLEQQPGVEQQPGIEEPEPGFEGQEPGFEGQEPGLEGQEPGLEERERRLQEQEGMIE